MHQDPVVMSQLGGIRSEQQTADYLARNLQHWSDYGFGLWIVRELGGGEPIGRALLRHLFVDGVDEVETGYALYQPFWGRGLATEIASACVALGRGHLGLSTVVAVTSPTNLASQRVLSKTGLVYEREFVHEGAIACLFRTRDLRRMQETPADRIQRVVREEVAIVPYDPRWPQMFDREKLHLRSCLPADLIGRIEHFGSTAVPGLAAKPVIDMLVEVTDLAVAKQRIAPVLESLGYDYFWRPTHGENGPPFYAWFIKRDPVTRVRTHHIHMVETDFAEHWDRLLFRDFLRAHPGVAKDYEALKLQLAAAHPQDRVAYTRSKTEFVTKVTERAKRGDSSV